MSRTGYVSGGPDMESAQYFCLHACYKSHNDEDTKSRVKKDLFFENQYPEGDCIAVIWSRLRVCLPKHFSLTEAQPSCTWKSQNKALVTLGSILEHCVLAFISHDQARKIWPHPNDPVPDGHKGETKKKSKKTANLRDKRGPTKCCLFFPAQCTFHTRGRESPQFLRL